MAGRPDGSTIAVMAQTTVVALTVTFLLLSNMKLLDRNWGFWMNKLHTHTRKKMTTSEHEATWGEISKELEEMTKRRLKSQISEKRLPAETKWYYSLFWLSYFLKTPSHYVGEGIRAWQRQNIRSAKVYHIIVKTLIALSLMPACILIFLTKVLVVQVVDILLLLCLAVRRIGGKLLSWLESGEASSTPDLVLKWLESPPRPIRDYAKSLGAGAAESSEDNASISTTKSKDHHDLPPAPLARRVPFLASLKFKMDHTSRDSSSSETNVENKSNIAVEHKERIKGEIISVHTDNSNEPVKLADADSVTQKVRRAWSLLSGRSKKSDSDTDEAQMRVGWTV